MNYELIVENLVDCGYQATLKKDTCGVKVSVIHLIGSYKVEFVHFGVDEIIRFPVFFINEPKQYGQVAHLIYHDNDQLGFLCVAESDSVSVNYEQPNLAFESSLQRHIDLFTKALLDSEWNKYELIREFQANWSFVCNGDKELILAADRDHGKKINIYSPIAGKKWGLDAKYLGVTDSDSQLNNFSYIKISSQREERKKSKAIGYVLSVDTLPVPPFKGEDIGQWYINLINNLPEYKKLKFVNLLGGYRSTEGWIVVNGPTPSGVAWVALHFISDKKRTLPWVEKQLNEWAIEPQRVVLFNPSLVMPRSGADETLLGKKVLLVGCGSVGSQIAMQLASSGVGNIAFADDDVFSLDNLYRHALSRDWVGAHKVNALKFEIEYNYPWVHIDATDHRLLELKNKELLESFDMIIIAIGSPTQERIFQDYIHKKRVKTPVINTWLEGYGIGGHATLDIPGQKGCLKCAYVDTETLGRGLCSNLNFIEENQDITVNHAGCGQLYLPYSGLHSTQTALIAVDLAVKYLNGQVKSSSKVSWIGSSNEAVAKGIKLSHRFGCFENSLQLMPLYNQYCDMCNE